MNNILVIAAHPDDEAIGCGGTLLKHQQQGDSITIIYMTNGVSSRQISTDKDSKQRNLMAKKAGEYLKAEQYFFDFSDNKMDETPLLNIVQAIESTALHLTPDIIYTHHHSDLNIDHQIVHKAVMTAFRPTPQQKTVTIYTFEVNSSTEWNTPTGANAFLPTCFVDISSQITNKMALLNIYKTEMSPYPHSRSLEAIEALAKVRGSSVGVNFAEAFMLIREIK